MNGQLSDCQWTRWPCSFPIHLKINFTLKNENNLMNMGVNRRTFLPWITKIDQLCFSQVLLFILPCWFFIIETLYLLDLNRKMVSSFFAGLKQIFVFIFIKLFYYIKVDQGRKRRLVERDWLSLSSFLCCCFFLKQNKNPYVIH